MNIYDVPFKVIPVRYNKLVPALFPIIETLLIIILRYSLLSAMQFLSPQSLKIDVLSWVS